MKTRNTYTIVYHTYTYTPMNIPSMKQKLTITVDSGLVPMAKRYARSQGVSLSSLIETELRDLVSGEGPSFASRWRGKFVPAEREDPRYGALARKYL